MVKVETTPKAFSADVTLSVRGTPESDSRLVLDALVESYAEYFAANRAGEISRKR